jgi:hypothetical protein
MKHVEEEQRFERREKRRKTNRMLNILIAIVLVLIIMFAYKLIADHQSRSSTSSETEHTSEPKTSDSDKEEQDDNVIKDENSVEETTDPVDEKVIVPTEDSDVLEAFINPSWEPIETVQSEPHETQFDASSQDWKEMIMAISYATELTESDFIIWRIENGNRSGVGPNKAIARIETKDRQYKYRVHIEWVTNEGWKPTLVEQLKA